MTSENYKGIFSSTVKALSDVGENSPMVHLHKHGVPMPSVDRLKVFMELMHGVMFPGYFMESDIDEHNIDYYIGARLDKAVFLLSEEIRRGKCFECQVADENECTSCQLSSKEIAVEFVAQLPEIRRLLSLDVEAAYEGDPAAVSQGETIFCYPSINVMTHYRIAHALYQLEVPLIPRIITEMAHAENGVDIHPQAQIGEKFFMDHGTGIVVGGTCIIGNNVKLYHGVTLGAKSFPLDDFGNPIKGIARHPIVEDNVVIYSGSTILGRITIGENSMIGGNVFLMEDVPPDSKILSPYATMVKK